MKKAYVFFALVLAFLSVSAQKTYPYFRVERTDGESTFKSEGLKISVSGANLVFEGDHGTTTFPIDSMTSMYFCNNTMGVESLFSEDEPVEVFTLSGVSMGKFESAFAAKNALKSSGVYLFKFKNETIKVWIAK